MCEMFEKTILTTGEKINAVKFMRPAIIDMGFPVICIDGTVGATVTLGHWKELMNTLSRNDIGAYGVGYPSTDTAVENEGIFNFPFIDHQHWLCNPHRLDLAFKDLFQKVHCCKIYRVSIC